MKKMYALMAVGVLSAASTNALAWTGPVCFPNSTKQVVITLREVQAAAITNPKDVGISYDDNDGELELDQVRASAKAGEYDFVFSRQKAMSGIVGVTFTRPDGAGSYKYELEFREGTCSGAKISAE